MVRMEAASGLSADAWLDAPVVRGAHKRALVTLSISHVVGAIGIGAGPSVGVLLAESMTDSELMAGLSRTASTVGAALASMPLAALAERAGRRTALSTGWLIAGTGALAVVVATASQSVFILAIGMLVFGAGTATTLQSRFAATDLAPRSHRARSLALVVWVGTLGAVLGPNIGIPGSWLESVTGLPTYAGSFMLATLFLAGGGAITLILLRPDSRDIRHSAAGPNPPATRRRQHTIRNTVRTAAGLLRSGHQRVAFVSLICAHTVMVTLMTMSPVHIHHHGGDITIVGITISLHVLGMFALAPLSGLLADRIGGVPTILVGTAVLAASIVTGLLWSDSHGGMMLCLFLLGWGWSFVTVASSAMLGASATDDSRIAIQGTADTTMNLVAAVAAGLSGPIMAAISFPGLSAVCGALLVPIVALAAVRFARGGQNTRHPSTGERSNINEHDIEEGRP